MFPAKLPVNLGIVIARFAYAKETMNKYICGELKNIEELDFEFLNHSSIPGSDFHHLVSTSNIF